MELLPDGGVKITLRKPIVFGSETIKELVLREPTAKDIRQMKVPPSTDDMLKLAGNLCGLTPPQIDMLKMKDTMEVLNAVGNFMDDSPETGKSG